MADNRVTIVLNAEGSEAVAKVFGDLAAKGQQFARNITHGAQEANTAISGLGASARTVFEIFTGVSLGNIFVQVIQGIKDTTVELVKLGHEARRQEESFRLVAESVGASSTALEQGLRRASDGLVNVSDVMLTAARSLQNSLRPDQLIALMEVARAQAKLAGKDVTTAFNDIAQAATTQQARQLKAYGIIIDSTKANEDFAKSLGGTAQALNEAGKTQAFVTAILAEMKGKLVDSNSEILRQEEALDRWKVAWAETREQIGKNIVAIANDLVSALDRMGAWIEKQIGWLKEWVKWLDLSAVATGHMAAAQAEAAAKNKGVAVGEGGMGGATVDQINRTRAFGAAVQDNAKFFDAFKAAMVGVDQTLALLNAKFAAFEISAQDMAKALEAQIAILQRTGHAADPEVAVKIANLTAQWQKLQQQLRESQSALTRAMFGEWIQGIEDAEAAERALAQEQVTFAESLREIDAALELFGDEQAGLAATIAAVSAEMIKQGAAIGVSSDAVQELRSRYAALVEQQDALRTKQSEINALVAAADAILAETNQTVEQTAQAWIRLNEAWDETEKLANVMGIAFDATNVKISLQQQKIQQLIKDGLDPFDESIQKAVADLNTLKALKFEESLAAIATQAELLGTNFDGLGATIAVLQQRFRDLAEIKLRTPEQQAEMEALAASINNLVDQKRVHDMISEFTDGFGQALEAVRGTLRTIQASFSDFFFVIGQGLTGQINTWKDFGAAIANVWKSMLNSMLRTLSDFFAQTLVRQLLGLMAGGGTGGIAGVAAGAVSSATGTGLGEIAGVPIPSGVGGSVGWQDIAGLGKTLGGVVLDLTGGLVGLGNTISTFGAGLVAEGSIFADAVLGLGDTVASLGSSLSSLGSYAGSAASTIGSLLPVIGIALGGFTLISDLINETITPLKGAMSGAAIGASVGTLISPGWGTLIGAAVGALAGAIIGWFGKAGEYIEKRAQAAIEANKGLQALSATFQLAARSQNPAQVQAALASSEAGGHVRVDLNLPPDLARQMGIAAGTTWAQLSAEQFEKVLALFKAQPALMQTALVGSGDVGYLGQAEAQTAANNAKQLAITLITAFNAIGDFSEQVNKLAETMITAAKSVLPPDFVGAIQAGLVEPLRLGMLALADSTLSTEEMTKALNDFQAQAKAVGDVIAFTANMMAQWKQISLTAMSSLPDDLQGAITPALEGLKAQMLSILGSGLDPVIMQQQLQDLQKEQAALGSLIATYDTINSEITAMSGNLERLVSRTVAGNAAALDALNENIATAQQNLQDSGGTASLQEEQALIAAVHDAVIARYEFEIKTIQALEKQIGDLLNQFGTPLATLLNQLASYQTITTGSTAQFQALQASYLAMANAAQSTTLQMWALQQGLAAVAAQAQASVAAGLKGQGPLAIRPTATGPGVDVTQIQPFVQGLYDAAAPFIARLQTLIAEALNRDDIQTAVTLLQHEQKTVQELAALAIQSVNEWADAAIRAVQEFAAAQIASVTALAKSQTDALQDQIDANDAIIAATERAAAAQIKANQAQIDADNKQIAAIQKAADAETKANQQQIDGLNRQISTIQKVADAQVKANQLLIDAASKQIDAIQKEAAARTKANDRQIDSLNDQIDAIQKVADAQTKANDARISSLQREVSAIQDVAEAQVKLNQARITSLEREVTAIQREAEARVKVNQQEINSLSKTVAAIEKEAAAKIKINDAEMAAIQDQIQGIQDIADAQRDANQARIDALGDERDTLQDLIRSTQEWQSVIDSLDKQIKGLLLGPSAPVNPMDQLLMAQQNFADALTGATTPEGIGRAQQAGDALIRALGGVFARTSVDYQRIFNDVIAQLQSLQTFATGERGPASLDDLKAQLEAVNAELKSLEDLNKQIVDAAKAQIEPLQAQLDALRELNETIRAQADTATGPLRDQIDALQELNQTIKDEADARLEPLQAEIQSLQDLNQTIKDEAEARIGPMQDEIQSLQDLNQTIKDTAEAQIGPLQEQVTALRDLNQTIKDTADAQIEPLQEQITSLQDLNTAIKDLAESQIEPLKTSVDTLTQANADIKAAADALIAPLQADVAALQELNGTIQDEADAITGPLREMNTALGAQITAINAARDRQIEAINQATTDQIDIINGVRTDQINAINEATNTTLTNIAAQMGPLVMQLVGVPAGIEAAMLGNKTATEFLTDATNNARIALEALNATLTAYLANVGVTPPAPPPAPTQPPPPPAGPPSGEVPPLGTWPPTGTYSLPAGIPANAIPMSTPGYWYWTDASGVTQSGFGMPIYAQQGAWRTKEGPYYLHDEEMVLPRQAAQWFRESMTTGNAATAPTINVMVTVQGDGDEAKLTRAVKQALEETETSLRIGRMNAIVLEKLRR